MDKRTIKTKLWRDGYFNSLDNNRKIFFLFLITNEYIGLSGIYELPLTIIAPIVKLPIRALETMKKEFEDNNKFMFLDDWIYIINYGKHNKFTPAPNIAAAFQREIQSIPVNVRKHFFSLPYEIPFHASKKVKIFFKDIDIVLDIDLDLDLDSTVGGTIGGTVQQSLATRFHKKGKENIEPDEIIKEMEYGKKTDAA